jgi:hypothetical protein
MEHLFSRANNQPFLFSADQGKEHTSRQLHLPLSLTAWEGHPAHRIRGPVGLGTLDGRFGALRQTDLESMR